MLIDLSWRPPRITEGHAPGGLHSGVIGWTTLIDMARACGRIKSDEIVTHIIVDSQGVSFRLDHAALPPMREVSYGRV